MFHRVLVRRTLLPREGGYGGGIFNEAMRLAPNLQGLRTFPGLEQPSFRVLGEVPRRGHLFPLVSRKRELLQPRGGRWLEYLVCGPNNTR